MWVGADPGSAFQVHAVLLSLMLAPLLPLLLPLLPYLGPLSAHLGAYAIAGVHLMSEPKPV